mmetsp:Transcript_17201/g.49908  ORF Transcript_17201/g.49908 Transcript_17201/m.49908 type:complete len:205 (+) Transcript_17201:1444-2058(+)
MCAVGGRNGEQMDLQGQLRAARRAVPPRGVSARPAADGRRSFRNTRASQRVGAIHAARRLLGGYSRCFTWKIVCRTFSPACTSFSFSSLLSTIGQCLRMPPRPTTTGMERKVSSSMPGTWPRTFTDKGITWWVSAKMEWITWRMVKPIAVAVQPRRLITSSNAWTTLPCISKSASRLIRFVSAEPPHVAWSIAGTSMPLCSPRI